MKIRFWGVRGSLPAPLRPDAVEDKIVAAMLAAPTELDRHDPQAVRAFVHSLPALSRGTAGGNTSCVSLHLDGQTIIIDAGTGIRELGLDLMQGPCGRGQGVVHLFFSHLHWDHIQGFPFFVPAFVPGNRIIIYGVHDIFAALDAQQRAPFFPVTLDIMRASLEFVQLDPTCPFELGALRVLLLANAHPGVAYSYRFEDRHSTLVYASDAEYKQLDEASLQPYVQFFRGADAVVFDAQFTLREAWQKEDWGHSSAMIGVDMARAAGVRRLILFHHDPTYSDIQLQEIQAAAALYQAQDASRPTCEIIVAHEGMTLDLTPPGTIDLTTPADGDAAIVTPIRVFDEHGVHHLARQLAALPPQGSAVGAIIDLSQVETLTTAGLKMLVALHRERRSVPLVLAAPSPAVRQVIALSGYADYFAIYPSVETAVAAVQVREALNLPGQVIDGRWQIERVLGAGRLGTVLRAYDTRAGRAVALKILPPSLSQQTANRLLQQSAQLQELRHRGIVPILAVGIDSARVYVAQELVNAPTLADYLVAHPGPMPIERALTIAIDVLQALEHIHGHGVIHGDLKPQNLFLTDQGTRIGDIGLGRIEEGRNLIETPPLFLATAYLAPEQIAGQPLDARIDLYALGVILYRMLAGRLPFDGTEPEIMAAHLSRTPPSPRELNPQISQALEHLTLKLLVRNPAERYPGAAQARRIIANLLAGTVELPGQADQPLVNRDAELAILQSCWQDASAGHGRLVFVAGEPGIGKTALTLQAASETGAAVVLMGRSQELASAPYHPFIEVLRAYIATVPPELADPELRPLLAVLAPRIPELAILVPNLPQIAELEPQQDQLRLISTMTRLMARAASTRPWVLILEDLHWADQGSLELLRYLGRHLPAMAMLLIGTYRDDELDRSHPLLAALRDLSRHPTYQLLTLERLDPGGVARLLAQRWGLPVPTTLAERIHRHTGGNPFYVEELARGLMDDGLVTFQEGVWRIPAVEAIRLPPGMREAVWQRVRHLNADTQTLLRQAAVLGPVFRFDDLCTMSGLSEWEVLEHLDMALERQIVRESPGEPALRFSHSEIHHVLYHDIGPLRRRLLHRHAGEALEARAAPHPERLAAELAHHYAEAGEVERALHYGDLAARQARAAFDNDAALRWYRRLLDLLPALPANTPPALRTRRLDIHGAFGETLTLLGRYDEALAQYTQARALTESHTAGPERAARLAALCQRAAEIYERRAAFETAREWVAQGLAFAGAAPATETARLHLLGATIAFRTGDDEGAIAACRNGTGAVAALSDPEARRVNAQALVLLGRIYASRGDLERAVQLCTSAVASYQALGDRSGETRAITVLANTYFGRGEWSRATDAHQLCLRSAQERGDIYGQAVAYNNLAQIYFHRGDYAEALDLYERSHTIWRQIGAPLHIGVALSNVAQVYLARRDAETAGDCLRLAETLLAEGGGQEYQPELERRWGEYYLLSGAPDTALLHLSRSVALAASQHRPLEEGVSLRVMAEIQLEQGGQAEALDALQRSLELLEGTGSAYEAARTRTALARLAVARNDAESARLLLEHVMAQFERLGARADLEAARQILRETPIAQ